MAAVKNGDTITVHYTLRLEDGTVLDTSENSDPLTFTVGEKTLIEGFEEAVINMQPGERKTVFILAENAYGGYREEHVIEVERNQLPSHLSPEIGQMMEIRAADGATVFVEITEITDSHVTLDGNHPLAGKNLTFDIELVSIA